MSDIYSDLRRDEGLRLKPYKCTAGKVTIGYGRNLDDVGISKAEAEAMLRADVTDVVAEITRKLDWFGDLSPQRQRALINMGFNLGVPRLMRFQKMLRALQGGDFERAADEALDSRWAKQVGARALRIAEMIREG